MAMEAMRVAAKESKIMKFILGGFIFLAVGGLVFTDVRGFFTGGAGRTDVAVVDGTTLTLREFDNDLRNVLQQTALTSQDAYESGLIDAYLEGRINNILQLKAAQELGIHPDNSIIAEQVKAMFGNLPRQQVEALMRAQGLTERGMADSIRNTIMTRYVTALPLSVTNYVPDYVMSAESRLASERRDATLYTISLDSFVEDQDVTDEQINQYYQNNLSKYTVPEQRSFTIGYMTLDMAKKALPAITEEDVKSAYEDRKEDFTVPETRLIEQVVLSNPDNAQAVYEEAMNGKPLQDAAKDVAGDDANYKSASAYEEKGLPEDLAEKAFADTVKKGDVLAPVKTLLGYTVMKVTSIEPARQKAFDEVKEAIREDLKQSQIYDALYNKMVDTEDMIDRGMSFSDVAGRTGLKTETTETFTKDQVIAGQKNFADIIKASPSVADELFNLPEGGVTYPVELDDTHYVVIGVLHIEEETVKTQETVKDDIIRDIKSETRTKMAEERLKEKLNTPEGISIPSKAKSQKLTDLSRQSDSEYTDMVFNANHNGYAYKIADNKIYIIKAEKPRFINKKQDTDLTALRQQQVAVVDSLLINYYRGKYEVTVNKKLLEQTYSANSAQ